ncbi:MAG: sugar transferase [Pseudomonadota bacterium]
MKRLVDISLSLFGLMLSAPILLPVMFLIYRQDKHSPFYVAPRVGRGGVPFRMIKLRSMIHGADKTGVDSTGAADPRITGVGRFVRRYKLDELPQLINVFKGDMSLVGPRPNVKRETDLYTEIERHLLDVKPGVTDIASIVFADENDILKDQEDPDIAYNQLIRPWKSRLGLLYVEKRSVALDLRLIFLTALTLVSRSRALIKIQTVLDDLQADSELRKVATRREPLVPTPPPGAREIVKARAPISVVKPRDVEA